MTVRLSGPARMRRLPVVDRRLLRSRATRLVRDLGRSDSELSIVLVADDEMATLNHEHRGIAAPTDVLSFSLIGGEHADRRGDLLGDVVISLETAAAQASAGHRGLDDEVARLLVHGTLHLLGWDHEDPQDARAMRAEERRLWGVIAS